MTIALTISLIAAATGILVGVPLILLIAHYLDNGRREDARLHAVEYANSIEDPEERLRYLEAACKILYPNKNESDTLVIKEATKVIDALYADFHAKVAKEEYQDKPEEKP